MRAEDAFRNLLDAWNTHQDLRYDGASVHDLSRSRAHLDQARQAIQQSQY